jgi:hypothetical protein
MSELDDAMKEHIALVVLFLHRPFSYLDFMSFEVGGTEYRMTPGTFRNKVSNLRMSGEVELAYRSAIAFYTLKGYRFDRPMTPTHTGGKSYSNDPFVRMIQNLPMGKNALHDIRLRFEVKGIWEALSTYYPEFTINYDNKDIKLPTWCIDDLLVRATVHRTDTISVSVACALVPVATDINGVIRLSNALTRVEERLAGLLKYAGINNDSSHVTVHHVGKCTANQQQRMQVLGHKGWIVIMWHFGTDSLAEYTGKKFSLTWEIGQNALLRAYTKTMKYKTRVRLERQEYPNKTLPEAIEEKLNSGGNLLE